MIGVVPAPSVYVTVRPAEVVAPSEKLEDPNATFDGCTNVMF